MQKNLRQYTTIIFDFGGVILDINPELSLKAFNELSKHKTVDDKLLLHILKNFEQGLINEEEFRLSISNLLGKEIAKSTLEEIWCLMLLDYHAARINKIKELGKSHKLILLSNTNSIHFRSFSAKLKREYQVGFNDLFSSVYLSNEMKLLKPDLAIFKKVLEKEHIDPSKTLFIEDTPENAKAAEKLGIHTLVIPRNGEFYKYLSLE